MIYFVEWDIKPYLNRHQASLVAGFPPDQLRECAGNVPAMLFTRCARGVYPPSNIGAIPPTSEILRDGVGFVPQGALHGPQTKFLVECMYTCGENYVVLLKLFSKLNFHF